MLSKTPYEMQMKEKGLLSKCHYCKAAGLEVCTMVPYSKIIKGTLPSNLHLKVTSPRNTDY